MGLDNYWVTEELVIFDPELRLCGGLCSGNGFESFRGKVYNDLVEGVTGVSLYTSDDELIPPETIKEMSKKLDNTSWKKAKKFDTWSITKEEYQDLQRMFREYAKVGASLDSWW
jgi:hypothetical protein